MKSMIRHVEANGVTYDALAFCCPGCAEMSSLSHSDGLHMLPVNTTAKTPSWDWDGDLDAPTLNPSILTTSTNAGVPTTCHSYLRDGVFEYLDDCTHSMRGQRVPMPDLPDWVVSA